MAWGSDFGALGAFMGEDEAEVCTLAILHSPSPHFLILPTASWVPRTLPAHRHISVTCCVLLSLCSSLLHPIPAPGPRPCLSLSLPLPQPARPQTPAPRADPIPKPVGGQSFPFGET